MLCAILDDQLSKRMYDLSQEVTARARAVRPPTSMLTALESVAEKYLVDPGLVPLPRDVKDHTIAINKRIYWFRAVLTTPSLCASLSRTGVRIK